MVNIEIFKKNKLLTKILSKIWVENQSFSKNLQNNPNLLDNKWYEYPIHDYSKQLIQIELRNKFQEFSKIYFGEKRNDRWSRKIDLLTPKLDR